VHNIVHNVLKTTLTCDKEFTNRVQCLSVAIKIFLSLLRRDKALLFASWDVCVELHTIATHCKVLHQILTTNIAVTEVVMKGLTPLITPADVVSWLYSTAELCCRLSNPTDACIFSTTALKYVKDISSTQESKLLKAQVFDVHGDVMSSQCEYELSLSYYEQARTIRTAIYDEQHENVAASHRKLGNVYCYLGQYSQAKEHNEKALIIRKKVYSKQHAAVAASYNNLRTIYVYTVTLDSTVKLKNTTRKH